MCLPCQKQSVEYLEYIEHITQTLYLLEAFQQESRKTSEFELALCLLNGANYSNFSAFCV